MVDKINITDVQANETNVDWYANGERANETVLNRPIKQIAEIVNDTIDELSSSVDNLAEGKVFRGETDGYVKDGDVVPVESSPYTHLRVLIGGVPTIVEMHPVADGTVSLLTETSATIGSTPVAFVKKKDNNKNQISVLSWYFNPPQDLPVYDNTVDWSDCINAADQFCEANGLTLYFPDGQYCIKKNVNWTARWATNSKSAELAPFPQLDDDKRFLRPGYKHLIPGVSIMALSGTYDTITTQRSDLFSTMKPAVKTGEQYATTLYGGLTIIQDMDVLDSGGTLTTPATDNRATGVDVGLLIDDSSACDFPNLTVFGYWDKAGTCVWTHGAGDNPDYIKFGFGSTTGYYGLALIGNDTAAGNGPGLSGTQCFGFQLFGNDHHSRNPQTLISGQTNAYGHVLFIDGKTAAVSANANGHEFFGGGWRTYSNVPIVLDNASNLHLSGVPFEFSYVSGQPDSVSPNRFHATANTFNVNIASSRNCTYELWDHANFGDVINKLMIGNDFYGDTYWGQKGEYIGILASGGGEEPRIIFTDNPASSEQNFTIRRDIPSQSIDFKMGGSRKFSLTSEGVLTHGEPSFESLVNGRLDLTSSVVNILPETAGVADTVTNIHPEVEGAFVTIRRGNSSANITVKDGAGITGENIRTPDGNDIVLDNTFKLLTLQYMSGFWIVVS